MEKTMLSLKRFLKENFVEPKNGKCPEGFVMSKLLGGCVPKGEKLHDMSAPEVGNAYPKGTPKDV